MKFHIIIPTYNRKDLVWRAIDSVLNQKSDIPFHVYIIDDGSIDGTWDLIKEKYLADNRISYSWKENGWVGSARNIGIEQAVSNWSREDIILFLDSDDEIIPSAFDAIINKKEEFPQIDYFFFSVQNEKGKKSWYNKKNNQIITYLDLLKEKKVYWEFFSALSLKILSDNHFRFPTWYNGWEAIFWLSINKKHNLLVTDDIVRIYYQDNDSIIRWNLDEKKISNIKLVTKDFINNFWDDLKKANKKLLWKHYLVYARMLALNKQTKKSLNYWWKWFMRSYDVQRFFLYILSTLPWWLYINNLLINFFLIK